MMKIFRSFDRWLKTRYGDKPMVVKGGAPPYRETSQVVSHPTHIATLIWRMVTEGAKKAHAPCVKYGPLILGIVLMVGLGARVLSMIESRAMEQMQKKIMKDVAFVVIERRWACMRKTLGCGYSLEDDPFAQYRVVRCDTELLTTGVGFDEPSCLEDEVSQTAFVLQSDGRSPEVLTVPLDVYVKHGTGSKVARRCNANACDDSVRDWPPQAEQALLSATYIGP